MLEKKAWRLLNANSIRRFWSISAVGSLSREIAMTLYRISRIREMEQQFQKELLEKECEVGTLIMQLEHAAFYNKQREFRRFREELTSIEKEKRELRNQTEEKLFPQYSRLLTLVDRQMILEPDDENRRRRS